MAAKAAAVGRNTMVRSDRAAGNLMVAGGREVERPQGTVAQAERNYLQQSLLREVAGLWGRHEDHNEDHDIRWERSHRQAGKPTHTPAAVRTTKQFDEINRQEYRRWVKGKRRARPWGDSPHRNTGNEMSRYQ